MIAACLGLARGFFFSLGFGAPVQAPVLGRLPFVALPLDFLARFSKIDDFTHPVPLYENRIFSGRAPL
jgi:hypothetical protein